MVARIVSDRDGAELAARLGEPAVVDEEDEHRLADRMLAEIRGRDATLAVIWSRGHSRPVGIVLGSATTTIVHEAPCSVLVAREVPEPHRWPRTIVAGDDGSPHSAAAVAAARALADRFGATLSVVTAGDADPVTVLAEESEDADLVVVGSRGLTGVRALGSVSERVAHEARCPVLVVRQ